MKPVHQIIGGSVSMFSAGVILGCGILSGDFLLYIAPFFGVLLAAVVQLGIGVMEFNSLLRTNHNPNHGPTI